MIAENYSKDPKDKSITNNKCDGDFFFFFLSCNMRDGIGRLWENKTAATRINVEGSSCCGKETFPSFSYKTTIKHPSDASLGSSKKEILVENDGASTESENISVNGCILIKSEIEIVPDIRTSNGDAPESSIGSDEMSAAKGAGGVHHVHFDKTKDQSQVAEPDGPQLPNDSREWISVIVIHSPVKSKIIDKNKSNNSAKLLNKLRNINLGYRPKINLKYAKSECKKQNGRQNLWIQGRIVANVYKISNTMYNVNLKGLK